MGPRMGAEGMGGGGTEGQEQGGSIETGRHTDRWYGRTEIEDP